MYGNGKMKPVKAIPGMGGGKDKGRGEFKYDIFDIL
jgi:hypothetical protein